MGRLGYKTMGLLATDKERAIVKELANTYTNSSISHLFRLLVNHPDFPIMVKMLLSPRRIVSLQDMIEEQSTGEG